MHILIIGQGISGTWLSYWFRKMGARITVMDSRQPFSASRVASGVINPVTGRQVVTTWMADTLLPFAWEHYNELGQLLGKSFIYATGIHAFPPSRQMMDAYEQKIKDASPYVHALPQTDAYARLFQFVHGGVLIQPAYWIHLPELLESWGDFLRKEGCLLQQEFEESKLEVNVTGVKYDGLEADYIFYCDGPSGMQSAWWRGLPFSLNKGEALIADIPELPRERIYKFGIATLVPWVNNGWWIGSTYDNRFEDALPSTGFREKMTSFLTQTLKVPFSISGHQAAIRPATVERRPFAGLHPAFPRVGILNGMGTKGVSLAPWLARQVADHVLAGHPIEPAADVKRFRRAFESSK